MKKISVLNKWLFCAASAATLSIAAPAVYAQDNAGDQADSKAASGDVVVVTARRREERLTDVPLSVTAVSGNRLEDLGATDLTAIQQITPNTTLEVSRGTNTTVTAFIRGVGQQDPVAGFEQGVGIYIDDVYLNRPQGSVLDIYDVQRVEVLRGPQGTLYGRNTIGGAIKYVTKRLNPDEMEARIRATGGTYGQADVVSTVSIPLTDTLRIGGTGAYFHRNGFGRNLNLGVDNYDKEVKAGRVSVEWEPTDAIFFRVAADLTNDDSHARQGHRFLPGLLSGAPVLDNVYDTRAGLHVIRQEVESKGISFLGEWNINDQIKLKNILAYREDDSSSPIDFDSLPAQDVDVPAFYNNDQLSEEFQLLYDADRLHGVMGFYYLNAHAQNEFDVLLATTGALPAVGLPGLNATTFGRVTTDTWSIFGDFTYDLTDQISVSVGGRYTSDERTSAIRRRTLIGGFSEAFGGNPTTIATAVDDVYNAKFTDFSPRASLSWKPTGDNTFYVTYSQGFKGGSFDPRCGPPAGLSFDQREAFCRFEPEQVNSYEGGWKTVALDGRVTASLAGFYSDYKDVQVPGSVGIDTNNDGVNDSFAGVTTNAAKARIYGIEFEGNAVVSEDMLTAGDHVNMSWSLGWIDAKYKQFIDATGTDVSNQRVFQNTPDWSSNVTLSYGRPLALMSRQGDISLLASVSYRSLTHQFETANQFLDQPGYALVDLGMTWRSESNRLRLSLNATNVTDKRYVVAGYNFVSVNPTTNAVTPTLGLEGTLTGFYSNPRQVFGTVEVAF